MPLEETLSERARLLTKSESRWVNEGGAAPGVAPPHGDADAGAALDATPVACVDGPPQTNAEIVQLKVRMIALESLLIALLADATPRQLAVAAEMAEAISPRPGTTQHRLTLQGAAHMRWVMERAQILRAQVAQTAQPPQTRP